MRPRILVVDDKPNMRRLVSSTLAHLGEVVCAEGGVPALDVLRRSTFHVIVTDIRMPDLDGHELLREIRSLEKRPEVVLMTAYATVDSAVEALRQGAFDYLQKPFDPDALADTVARALTHRGVSMQAAGAKSEDAIWCGMIGASPQMRELFRLVDRLASSDATVLLLGESGTGKELLARAIHDASPRASGPFVAVSCAAIPPAVMEAELFGHAKGAYAGAVAPRAGLFEQAHGGTLFLDEIGEMRRALQAKLTRALESRTIRRVGEAHERPVDVRVVSATHRDLPALVSQGAFREDLYYRLNTCVIRVPPLREREGDVRLLVEHFLSGRTTTRGRAFIVTPEAMAALEAHPWPGNVRELRGVLERASLVADDGMIARDVLPQEISGLELEPRSERPYDLAALTYREALERVRADGVRRYLQALLERAGGNVVAAAELADVERESFYRLCRKHGVNPAEFRAEPKPRS